MSSLGDFWMSLDSPSEASADDGRNLGSPDGAGSYKEVTAEAVFVGGGSVPEPLVAPAPRRARRENQDRRTEPAPTRR